MIDTDWRQRMEARANEHSRSEVYLEQSKRSFLAGVDASLADPPPRELVLVEALRRMAINVVFKPGEYGYEFVLAAKEALEAWEAAREGK